MEKTKVTCSFGNDEYGLQTGTVKISDLHDFKGHAAEYADGRADRNTAGKWDGLSIPDDCCSNSDCSARANFHKRGDE